MLQKERYAVGKLQGYANFLLYKGRKSMLEAKNERINDYSDVFPATTKLLKGLGDYLKEHIKGQDYAIDRISEAYRKSVV